MSSMRRYALGLLLVLGAVLFAPSSALAQSLRIDLNGDGIRDSVHAGRHHTGLTIHIANEQRIHRLRTDDAVVRLASADVDHDGDVDLVALTVQHGLRIWLNGGRGRFVRMVWAATHPHSTPQLASIRTAAPQTNATEWNNDSSRPLIHASTYGSAHAVLPADVVLLWQIAHDKLTADEHVSRGPPSSLRS